MTRLAILRCKKSSYNIIRFEENAGGRLELLASIFYHFPKNLDRTITFYSVTFKNTRTEPQKNIIFFSVTNNI